MNGSFKRTLSLLLAIVMCFSLLPLTAFAADGEEEAEIALLTEDEQDDGSREEQEPEAVLTDAAETEETPAPEAEEVEIETPEGEDMAPAAEEEVLPARVNFICTPEELALIVFDADGCVMDSEEDGSYLLIPGEYSYTAICEGYQSAENVPFTVESDTEIEVTLDPAKPLLKTAAAPKMALAAMPSGVAIVTSASNISGSEFTSNASLASKLDTIFAGNIGLYTNSACTSLVNAALGTRSVPNNDVNQYWKSLNGALCSGTSCYAYANAFYGKLYDGTHPHHYVSSNHQVIKNPSGKISYQSFCDWGVRSDVPSYIRVGNHSIIVLTYDSNYLTYADGNGDGNALVAVRRETWRANQGTNIYANTVSLICQPTTSYIPVSGTGYLSKCTYYPSYCQVKTTKSTTLKTLPCSVSTDPSSANVETLSSGVTLTVVGLYKNSADHYWYKVDSNDTEGFCYLKDTYMFAGDATYLGSVSSSNYGVSVSGTNKPSSITRGNFYPVTGSVNSKYNGITSAGVQIYSGSNVTSGTAVTGYMPTFNEVKSVSLSGSIDTNTKYNDLSVGSYSYVVKANIKGYYSNDGTTLLNYTRSVIAETANFSVVEAGHTHSYTTKVIAPTCTAQGYTLHSCSCGTSYQDSYTSALGHTWNSGTVTKAASCTADGVKTYTCTVCSTTKTEAIAKLGHNYTSRTVAGNCTTPGKTVYTCSRCSDSYEEVNANWSAWSTTKPTGIPETYIQSRTEYRTQQKETTTSTSSSMSGWTPNGSTTQWTDYGPWSEWSPNAVSANDSTQVETRTAYGWYYFYCTNCGKHMHGYGTCWTWAGGGCGATTTKDHSNTMYSGTNWNVAKDWYGTGKYYAEIDGEIWFRWNDGGTRTEYRYRTRQQQTIYNYYRWGSWSGWSTTPATASSTQNVETRTTYRYNTLVGEHVSDSGTVTKAAACTTEGVKTYKCTECGETLRTESIAALGHSYDSGKVTKAASCAETGVKTYTCTRSGCGATKTETIEKLTTHTSDNGTVTKAATCTETGTKTYTCTVCKTTIRTETVPALGHTFSGNWSKDGNYHWHAATCGHVNEEKDKAEHSWDDGTVTKAATESETGIKTYSCTVCKQTKTETIPKLAPATAPVISIVGTKGRPGKEITVSVVLKNNPGIGAASFAIEYDHSKLLLTGFEDGGLRGWLVGVGAGEKANWTTTDYLNNNMLNGEILKLKFNILDTAALGETVVSVKEIDVTDVDAEPVEFSGQSGTVNIIRVIPGDVNDDGKVGSGDALLVKKHLAGYEVSLVMEAADVNGDGKVGSADALLIQKYLAGYDVILK